MSDSKSKSVDILYLITNGFAARMVLHSDLIPELKKHGLSIGIVTHDANEGNIHELAQHLGIEIFQLPELNNLQRFISAEFRQYVYEDIRNNPALWWKHLWRINGEGVSWRRRNQFKFYYLINRTMSRNPLLRKAMLFLERKSFRNSEAGALIESIHPKLVITTYPPKTIETVLLHEASRSGITTVGHLLSWDNITCKGHFIEVPEWFIAWGPIMRNELLEYYSLPSERILETGVPHFDAHIKAVSPKLTRKYLSELGLNPDKPYIFFGMSPPIFSPYEVEIVEKLANWIINGVFGNELQMIVRPHPASVSDDQDNIGWLPRLREIKKERIAVDFPVVNEGKLPANVDSTDLLKLVNLIAGCSISLNSGSTLIIDSIMQDKPVILTLFDAGKELPWWSSARRMSEFPHLNKLIRLGGLKVAHSYEDLKDSIKAYLTNPSEDAEGREKVRQQEVGSDDGHASERVAEAIVRLLK